ATTTSTLITHAALTPLSDATAAPTTTTVVTSAPTTTTTPPATPASGSSDGGGVGSGSIPNLSSTTKPNLGIQQIIPIGKDLLGVRFNSLLLGLSPGTDPSVAKVQAEVSVSLTLSIG